MLSSNEWNARQNELEELIKQRDAISKRIHLLKKSLNQHEKHKIRRINTNSEVYKMFGKPLKDLTKEEKQKYYNDRQRKNREKKRRK